MIRYILIAISMLLGASIGCSTQKPLMIGRDADKTSVTVSRAVPFTIALPGNASTGFAWHVRAIDTTVVVPAGAGRFVGRDTIPGTSGTFFLDFTPKKKGVSTIALTYNRDFEVDVPPEDSFRVLIRVK